MVKKSGFVCLCVLVIISSVMVFISSCNRGVATNSNIVVWAATGGGVSKTEDGGKTWVNYFLGEGKYVHSIAVGNGVVWAGTESGVCKSLDSGKTWTTYDSDDGLPSYHLETFKDRIFISALCIEARGNLWIGCRYLPRRANTLGRTQDGGKTWALFELSKGKVGYEISSIISVDSSIWVGALGTRAYSSRTNPIHRYGGLYRTDDNGKTWSTFTTENGLSGNRVSCVFNCNNHIYVATDKGIDMTKDFGKSWEKFAPDKFNDFDVAKHGISLFVVNDQEVLLAYGSVFSITRDAGKTWNDIDIASAAKEHGIVTSINSIQIINGEIWLGVTHRSSMDEPLGSVLKSVDGGKKWSVYTVDDGIGGYVYDLAVQR